MISTSNLHLVQLSPNQRQESQQIASNGHAPVKKCDMPKFFF